MKRCDYDFDATFLLWIFWWLFNEKDESSREVFFFFLLFFPSYEENWPLGISDFDPMAVMGPILV